MSFYTVVLVIHSALRWLVLLLCLVVLVKTFAGWRRAHPWGSGDESLHVALVAVMDLQFLLGLLLYAFLSPLSRAFLADPSEGMRSPLLRFFGMEHAFAMVVALAILHIGRATSRRIALPARRHARVFVTTLLALVVILIGIPWPFMRYGRPVLRAAVPVGSSTLAVVLPPGGHSLLYH